MAYFFVPPTVNDGATTLPTDHPGNDLWKHFRANMRGVNVWIVNGVATEVEPDRGSSTSYTEFLGAHVHTITAAERTILIAGGYSANITGSP